MARTRTVEPAAGVPAGLYVARVKEIEDGIESQFDNKLQVKFVFEIEQVIDADDDDPDAFVGEEQWAWANDVVSPNSKLYLWACRLLGRKLDMDDTFDLDDLIDCTCKLTISENKNGRLTVTDLQPHRESRNGRRSSAKRGSSKRRRRQPEPEPEYDDDDAFEDEEDEDFD